MKTKLRRNISLFILWAFLANTVLGPVAPAYGQAALPLPGSMVGLSAGYAPTLIKGLRVYPDNPLRFDFIVDPGDSGLQGEDFKQESTKLMKYFLSSLTVPEKDLWVNLSPYEKDRIIPDAFSKTEMGRDMLGQDYILKQLTSSLIYPDSEMGKTFWTMAYQKAQEAFGTKDVPVNTFNKIWIVPQKAVVYAKNNVAYVVESHLKVMLEEDYLALQENQSVVTPKAKDSNAVGSEVVRKIILPAIEKEVNEGQNFAPLRQVYNSLILATWFKRNLRESILGKVYVGQNKIDGITFEGETNKEKIYQSYLEAFHKGVYNIIKEEEDAVTHEMIPRKYFSGGIPAFEIVKVLTEIRDGTKVASSALNTRKTSLFVVELGKPQADANIVQNGDQGSSSSAVFTLRDNPVFGAPRTMFVGQYKTTKKAGYTYATEGKLNLTIDQKQAIQQFRAAFENVSNDPITALQALRPLVEYIKDKYASEANFRAALGSDLAGYFEYLSLMSSNENVVNVDQKYARNLLAQTLDVIKHLPGEVIIRIMYTSRDNLNEFLSIYHGSIKNWDNVDVAMVLNAGDIVKFKDKGNGRAVLEADLLHFLSKARDRSRQLAWRLYLRDDYPGASQRKDMGDYADANKNDFIKNNMAVVAEVIRILQFMEWTVDYYYGVGRITTVDTSQFRESLLQELRSDERNRQLVRLIEQLGMMFTVEQTPKGDMRVPDTARRVDAILQFILNKPRLAKRANIQVPYTEEDVTAIAALSRKTLSLWFYPSQENISASETKDTTFPGDRDKPAAKNDANVQVVTRTVYEEGVLREREGTLEKDSVPKLVFADGPEEKPSRDGVAPLSDASETRRLRKMAEERTILIPLDRSDAKYTREIQLGIDQMRAEADEGKRARIFFAKVWVKFLVSRAEGWQTDVVDDLVKQSILLLDPSVGRLMLELLEYSKIPKDHRSDIDEAAAKLRNNTFLTDHRIYVNTEVIDRQDSLRKSVTVLSMIVFNIDDIVESDIDGQNTSIRFLGDRIDQLDQDISALGFMYLGDGHGVVLKQAIRRAARADLLPALNEVPFMIAEEDGQIHPMYLKMRQAYQRDNTLHPAEDQVGLIFQRRYRSTARHEGQHIADEKNRVQGRYSGIEQRIAQELNAYLASIADEDSDGTPNMPFTDLAETAQLYLSLSSELGFLSDSYGIYRDASAHILLMFAEEFGIIMTIEDLQQLPKTNIDKILGKALELDSRRLKDAAKWLLIKSKEDQSKGKSYKFKTTAQRSSVPALVPPLPTSTTTVRGAPNDRSSENADMSVPEQENIEKAEGSLLVNMYVELIARVKFASSARHWALVGTAALAMWGLPSILGQEEDQDAVLTRDIAAAIAKGDKFQTEGESFIPLEKAAQPMLLYKSLRDFSLPFVLNNAEHRVQASDKDLSHIAAMYYGKQAGGMRGAMKIYSANADKLSSPDNITAGMTLIIPDAELGSHFVQPGDTLSAISLDFYADPSQWRRIRDANKDQLVNGLQPGIVLRIPMSAKEAKARESWAPSKVSGGTKVSDASPVGGINLDPSGLMIDQSGEELQLDVPADPRILQNLDQIPVSGFVPVILNIVPIGNLPQFLGIKNPDGSQPTIALVK